MRHLLRGRRSGRLARKLTRVGRHSLLVVLVVILVVVLFGGLTAAPLPAFASQNSRPAKLEVQITSPLGRTGIAGPTRIVARVIAPPGTTLSSIQFYVDGKLIGEDKDGAPYAVEWTDDNPFEPREIAVGVADSAGNVARDRVLLQPLDVREVTSVSSVLLEPSVVDSTGRPVNGLAASDFQVFEDGVPQTLDLAMPDAVPATYTLLVDSSGSMSRRMDFVREAARLLPFRLRPNDQVLVAPFSRTLGTITGPTRDHDTIAGAIGAIQSGGGTAILDNLAAVSRQIGAIDTRHIIVLITDGYDEDSEINFDRAMSAIRATKATVYVIAIAGVAGVSLKGEELLRRIATATGGRAFFPARDIQLADMHALIAADVQQRYVITYTPSNQKLDGTWRAITVKTPVPTHLVRVRAGYFAPAPPPIRPQIELTIRDVSRQTVDVSAGDLVLLEDGVEQQIEAFQEALAPVSAILVLDASGSMRKDAAGVVEAARTFVGALPAKDRLAVMHFADKPLLVNDLSTDREASLDAISQYTANGGTALYDALIESLLRLKRVEGRRIVVLLSDGRDENNPGTAPGSVHTFEDVLKTLKEVDATVFPIGLGPKVDRALLERVADVSGGEAYFPQVVSSLTADYHRVLENLRRRYILTYTSTNSARDGSWRTIEIRSSRSGLVINNKGGYNAPDK